MIGGVRRQLSWLIPDADAILLVSDSELAHIAPESSGFALATLTGAAEAMAEHGRWSFATVENGQDLGFICTRAAERRPRPIYTILFALFLACLALPATTPLPLGEYPAAQHPRFAEVRWRRWFFLSVKLVCVTLIVAFASLVVSFGLPWVAVENGVGVQLLSTFAGLLFSFRWALRDQRLRCPVCLCLLTNPARVGHPSRSFLAWHGTEFMCDKGHGLLHVPDLATSWFSTQRWLSLDGSWSGLFPNLADR